MEVEKLDFFSELKELYNNRMKLESKIVPPHVSRSLKITNLFQNEEAINCMDLIDLTPDESLIVVCSDTRIKLYSHENKLNKLFEFVIQYEVNEHLDYEVVKQGKQKKFLQLSKELTLDRVKEVLLYCHFAYVNCQLFVLAGGEVGFVYQIEIKENPEYSILEGHHHIITGLSSNDKCVFSCSKDGSVIQWDTRNKQIIMIFRDKEVPGAEVLSIAANDDYVLGAYSDGKLRIWKIEDLKIDNWSHETKLVPELVFQSPLQDVYPHIGQVFLLKHTIVAKHINGTINYFVFDMKGNVQSLHEWEMSGDNFWECIGMCFPYVIFTHLNRMQVVSLKSNKLIYEAELDAFPPSKLTITKVSSRMLLIGRMKSYAIF